MKNQRTQNYLKTLFLSLIFVCVSGFATQRSSQETELARDLGAPIRRRPRADTARGHSERVSLHSAPDSQPARGQTAAEGQNQQ